MCYLLSLFGSLQIALANLEATPAAFPVSLAVREVTGVIVAMEIHATAAAGTGGMIRVDIAIPRIIHRVLKFLLPISQICHRNVLLHFFCRGSSAIADLLATSIL